MSIARLSLWILAIGWTAVPLFAADHLDSPSVQADGRLDINDLYAFRSPSDVDHTVLVMTVNPLAGVMSPTSFHPVGQYQLHLDLDRDALTNVLFEARFSAVGSNKKQRFELRRNGTLIARGMTGHNVPIRGGGGGRVRADLFEDPFFFDLLGFRNGFQFTGSDFFAGLNVTAIIVELPSASLASNNIGVWARTALNGNQIDRMGRPAINTALIPSARKDLFNVTVPVNDPATFGTDVINSITGLSGDAAYAAQIAGILLPDILTIDTANGSGFLNGRRLEDDVIDAELTLLTKSATPVRDGVDSNDATFSSQFPYLAPPNELAQEAAGRGKGDK